ncbi:NAD-dependent succinate-semialdehyde dehydrogenase [Paenarthrobacter sp. NPDC090520]|uniref:NAD-dependent succinate-semialdehyde dehydrogenase n=1 Tax=unclassified Paenarthrobacter TaxID=2634190 RepID=UPI0038112172
MSADLFINGAWVTGEAGILDNVDPGTGSIVGQVSLASAHQVAEAIAAADAAFASWSRTLPSARGDIIKRASQILSDRIDEAAATILLETGKTQADARGEIQRSIDTLRWNGEAAGRIQGRSFPGIAVGSRRSSTPAPLGVAALINAWNFPAVLATRKLGAALAAGCTVVLKAAEYTPATARLIVEIFAEAGLPEGVINLVFGDPAALSQQLLSSPEVKILSFTGSTHVGKLLAEQAAPTLTRHVLELGGHAPVIVWDDADVEHVIATTAGAKFGSAGQSCVAPSRYYVHESLYSDFVEAFAKKAQSYVLGHGNEDGVTMGAVAHQGRVDALVRLTEDAVAKGARLVTGGHQVKRDGFFFEPTILADVPQNADIVTEEPFGPIAAVIPVGGLDEALELANANPYSFTGYLFTDSLSVQDRVTAELNVSNIGINQLAPSLPDVPLGGMGNSGVGYEGGLEGILAYTQLRLVSQTAN